MGFSGISDGNRERLVTPISRRRHCNTGRRRSPEEMEQWCEVGRAHPGFFEAFVKMNGQGQDLDFIKRAPICRYHDHGDTHHEDGCRTREEEWYPLWMFDAPKQVTRQALMQKARARKLTTDSQGDRAREEDDLVQHLP